MLVCENIQRLAVRQPLGSRLPGNVLLLLAASLPRPTIQPSCSTHCLQYQRKGQITDEVLFGRGRQ